MAIKICDAIMGSGKTSAVINLINAHPDRRFIYISPYLSEATRIQNSCPELHFIQPSDKLPEHEFKKYNHSFFLINEGKNIATTHAMFKRYSDEMKGKINEYEYTLINDESVETFSPARICDGDYTVAEGCGMMIKKGGVISFNPDYNYHGNYYKEIQALAKGNRLVEVETKAKRKNKDEKLYYWIYSKELLCAFKDIYVLTYMFDAQVMSSCLKFWGLEYENIWIRRDENGEYNFSEYPDYVPEYASHLSEKIHIYGNKNLNSVGDGQFTLSSSWFDRSTNKKKKETLRKNMYNFDRNYNSDKSTTRFLWTSYKKAYGSLRSKGYYKNWSEFNLRATNDYREKDVLAYCVNVFLQPDVKNFFISQGIPLDEDRFATSMMVQWIFRSAIRDGKDISVYIPSERMRNLLKKWISEVEKSAEQVAEQRKLRKLADSNADGETENPISESQTEEDEISEADFSEENRFWLERARSGNAVELAQCWFRREMRSLRITEISQEDALELIEKYLFEKTRCEKAKAKEEEERRRQKAKANGNNNLPDFLEEDIRRLELEGSFIDYSKRRA